MRAMPASLIACARDFALDWLPLTDPPRGERSTYSERSRLGRTAATAIAR